MVADVIGPQKTCAAIEFLRLGRCYFDRKVKRGRILRLYSQLALVRARVRDAFDVN